MAKEEIKITHLQMMKHFVENDPWQIAHRLFTCTECPKLSKCMKNEKDIPDWETRCRASLDEWLNEEVSQLPRG